VANKELNFEASGALKDAALIMQDRETDSWWSIMTSDSIGGKLQGNDLVELPVSQKMTWGEWKAQHPGTMVLSVEGEEHVENNPYTNYFNSEATFRDMEVTDDRLAAKTPIFTFWLDGKPYAVPNSSVEGGKVFQGKGIPGGGLLLFRQPGAHLFASTEAYRLQGENAELAIDQLLSLARKGEGEMTPLEGFDTFWYNWVAVNKKTKLLR
jgi:hypothetical protein